MNKVLLVYPGLGKTFLAKSDDRIQEIQTGMFKNLSFTKLGTHVPENMKGEKMEFVLNPDFPNNILKCIDEALKAGKFIVMALKDDNIDFLIEHNLDFIFIIPAKNKIDQLKKQYIERGNTDEYVKRNINNLIGIEAVLKKYNKEFLYINKDEHLVNIINKLSNVK